MNGIKYILFFLFVSGYLMGWSQKSDKKVSFRDSTDHAYDISDFLLNKKGFLFVPSVITEPAVGYGGAAAAVYFHSSYANKKSPPSMTGAFGMGTENGTWGAGVFHIGYWKKDRIRYAGAIARLNVNVGFYGTGDLGLVDLESVELNMDSWLLVQQIKFRIGETSFFSGGRFLYFDTNNTYDIPEENSELTDPSTESVLSEATFMLNYDSRNNIFSPGKGFLLELAGTYSDTWMGSDALYGRINTRIIGYVPAGQKMLMGVRNENTFSLGDIPLYARPIVMLRGAPMMKYQNNHTTVTEIEMDWNVYKRWNIVGFTGIGNAFESFDEFSNGNSVASIGTGFRYLLARKFGMQMGMDFAKSTDDFAFYFVIGTSWMR